MTTDQKPAAEFPPRIYFCNPDLKYLQQRCDLGDWKGDLGDWKDIEAALYPHRRDVEKLTAYVPEAQLKSVTRERDDEKKNYQECLKTLNAVSSANRELNAQLENTRELLKMLYEQLPTWFVLQDADWKRLRKELGE